MSFELISDSEFASLPEEPTQKFIAFEQICRRNLNGMITPDSSPNFDALARMQYMSVVAAAAEELGVSGLDYPASETDAATSIDSFLIRASAITTRLKLRSSGANQPYSVRLGAGTRGRIEQQIEKLRQLIRAEQMSEPQRRALLAKLDELSIDLSQTRVSFAKTMAVLAFVGATVTGGTAFLAEAPRAMATIVSLLGKDKLAEDAEANRLGPNIGPRALPPIKPPAAPGGKTTSSTTLSETIDDDIPF